MDEPVNGQSSKASSDATDTDLCLHQLFEAQARRTPDAQAVEDEHVSLTYEELDRQADLLAAHLRAAGVGPDALVGVYMNSCADYVVACLAALKAGGAYLVLEMAYPEALLAEVVADADPSVVLTHERHAGKLPEEQNHFCLDDGWEKRVEDGPWENRVEPTQDSLAFVSYSAGTTGKPKGIANPHRAPVRSYLWRYGIVDYEDGGRAGCNIFFVWEMWRPLLRGATTVVIPDHVIYDPSALISFLEEREITEAVLTPSLLGSVFDVGGPDVGQRLRSLKTLIYNGEVVTRNLAERTMNLLPETRALNVYSISETHEVAAGYARDLLQSTDATYCPVGRLADPEHTYVLDEDTNPVPEGEEGELYVGGDWLARGYVNLPETTAERFVDDPFADEDGARMYRTGDGARMLPDGNLEILGRVDFMAKVRGYSVQLGAVEAAIENRLAVWDCVVIAEGEEGEDKRLVAYLVPSEAADDERESGWDIDARTGRSPEVRRLLQEELPHYMIPAVFVEVETLPLQGTTGKVDRKNLPDPPARVAPASTDEIAEALPDDASRSEKEDRLARIFEAVLRLEEGDVGSGDDFFDVGGHSLAAAELVEAVEAAFGVRLPIQTVLENPTVAGMRGEIEARQKGESDDEDSARKLDLRAEAVLEPEISPEAADSNPTALRDAAHVFLTGATGFLGAFLLDGLLARTDAKIHCLARSRQGSWPMDAIRENLKQYSLWNPENAHRVVPVAGDLGEPLLGLEEEAFDALADETDVIVHAAAAVNLAYPYSALRAANVGGTRETLRLACRGGATPVHFVSSNGIFAPGMGSCGEDADLDALADAREDGYGQSKWVAEKLVWQAAGRGLPVGVYRPGNISGHSESGASNPRDLVGAILAGSLRAGLSPEAEGWRVEMTPVDFVAGAILHLADNPEEWNRAFHLANPAPPAADEVFSWLEDAVHDLEPAPYAEWLERVHDAAPPDGDDPITGVLRGAAPEADDLDEGNTYDDRNLRRALDGSGLRRPETNSRLLETYARYFAEQGWVPEARELSGGRRSSS